MSQPRIHCCRSHFPTARSLLLTENAEKNLEKENKKKKKKKKKPPTASSQPGGATRSPCAPGHTHLPLRGRRHLQSAASCSTDGK